MTQIYLSLLTQPRAQMQVWKKFSHYNIEVDEKQDDKAVEILLCSFARPHMRYVTKMNKSDFSVMHPCRLAAHV